MRGGRVEESQEGMKKEVKGEFIDIINKLNVKQIVERAVHLFSFSF